MTTINACRRRVGGHGSGGDEMPARACPQALAAVRRQTCAALAAVLLAAAALADDAASTATSPALPYALQPDDCVAFREGGVGLLLRTPVYWLRGSIVGISRTRRMLQVCPRMAKPVIAYTRADHLRLAAAMPCVGEGAVTGEVEVMRVRVAIDDWETPWSPQHGTTGWLFAGRFLDQTLKKGALIDMDASWLLRCEEAS